jgi:hypothetical protein
VDAGDADLVNADGLVRQGGTLEVVRNFFRILTTLHLTADGCSATLRTQYATDLDRVLTTAATLKGRALFVDSKFDESVISVPSEVINDTVSR